MLQSTVDISTISLFAPTTLTEALPQFTAKYIRLRKKAKNYEKRLSIDAARNRNLTLSTGEISQTVHHSLLDTRSKQN